MNLRARIERLEREAQTVPPANELRVVLAVPPDSCQADGKPVGSHLNGDGTALLIVAERRPTDEEIDAVVRSHRKRADHALIVKAFIGD